MIERLVGDWLTEVDERGYQLPFCQVLISRGYEILHISSHGPGEHGKDVIARAGDGTLETFQLKKGDLTLGGWRDIRGEVQELVELPVRFPGVDPRELHRPFLVLSGQLRGDARDSIDEYADLWAERGAQRLGVIPGGVLQQWFLEAHGTFLPTGMVDFKHLVQLYTSDPEERLDVPGLTRLLSDLMSGDHVGTRPLDQQRAINSLVLVASYVVTRFSAVGNNLGAAEGWTVTAAAVLQVAERLGLPVERYDRQLSLIWKGYWAALEALEAETLEAETFVLPKGVLAEPAILPLRTTLILSWVSCLNLTRRHLGLPGASWRRYAAWIRRHLSQLRMTSEADWPGLVMLSIWVGYLASAEEGEFLLLLWLRGILQANAGDGANGFPNPYWSAARVIEMREGMLAPHELERFANHSYTALSALDMLVRRLRRAALGAIWPSVSRLHFCDFLPGSSHEWFAWRAESGRVTTLDHPQPVSWSAWRETVGQVDLRTLPLSFERHPEWVPPFLLVFPHRANRAATGFLDAVFGRYATLLRKDPEPPPAEVA